MGRICRRPLLALHLCSWTRDATPRSSDAPKPDEDFLKRVFATNPLFKNLRAEEVRPLAERFQHDAARITTAILLLAALRCVSERPSGIERGGGWLRTTTI